MPGRKKELSHYQKKDPTAHEEWVKRKASRVNLVSTKSREQVYWRQVQLDTRRSAGKLTEKNRKEITTVFGEDSPHTKVLLSLIK